MHRVLALALSMVATPAAAAPLTWPQHGASPIRLSDESRTDVAFARSEAVPIDPATPLTLSFEVRARDVAPVVAGLAFLDASGAWLAGRNLDVEALAEDAWGAFRVTFRHLPPEAAAARVVLSATLWRDELVGEATFRQVRLVAGEPLAASAGVLLGGGGPIAWIAPASEQVRPGMRPPEPRGDAPTRIDLVALRGEREAFQIAVMGPATIVGVTVGALSGPAGALPPEAVSVREVAMVPIEQPSDPTCLTGLLPDPLPELRAPWSVPSGEPRAVWVTVSVPRDAPAGTYDGAVRLSLVGGGEVVAPLRLRVVGVTLPRAPSLRTSFDVPPLTVARWHGLVGDTAALDATMRLYYRDMADHRISAMDPMQGAAIDLIAPTAEGRDLDVTLDTERFDAAAEFALDELGMTGFRLWIEGLQPAAGAPTRAASLFGFAEGTPEYAELSATVSARIADHLAQRGWLERAYLYPVDEPHGDDLDDVSDLLFRVGEQAPGLPRLVTAAPSAALTGAVDIWVPLLSDVSLTAVADRQGAGEQVWTYVSGQIPWATPNLLVDRPAMQARMLPLLARSAGLDGLLLWNIVASEDGTNAWASTMTVLPDGVASGHGDGRLVYPPRPGDIEPGPVPTQRWELLREGLEDIDRIALLERAVRLREQRGDGAELEVIVARALCGVPPHVARGRSWWTEDLLAFEEWRRQVIDALERTAGPLPEGWEDGAAGWSRGLNPASPSQGGGTRLAQTSPAR